MNFLPKKWTKNHFTNIILPLHRKIKSEFAFGWPKSIEVLNKNLLILYKKRCHNLSCIHKFLLQITKYCAALQKSNLYIVVLCKWWYFRHFYFARRYDIINVSSTTALKAVVARQSVLQTVVCFKNTLSRRFLLCARPCAPLETFCMTSCHKRLFKADTFLDVKLIPPYGRTKVQGKFV